MYDYYYPVKSIDIFVAQHEHHEVLPGGTESKLTLEQVCLLWWNTNTSWS